MASDEFSEVNVYCRFRPSKDSLKKIHLKYTEDGHITLTDDKEVGSY